MEHARVLAIRRFGEFTEIRRRTPRSSGAGFHEAYIHIYVHVYIHDETIRQLKIIHTYKRKRERESVCVCVCLCACLQASERKKEHSM